MVKATRIVLCVLAFIGTSAHGQATTPVGIRPGSTVRFQIGGDISYRSGVLSRLTADSLIVERCPTCQGRLFYGRGELTRLDVSKRVPSGSRVLSGFAIGGIVGFALGFLLASTCRGIGDQCDAGIVVFAGGGVFGSLIGATAGYLSSYKWEPLPLTR